VEKVGQGLRNMHLSPDKLH